MRVSAAGNMPLQGLVKPPAKPVVMILEIIVRVCYNTDGLFVQRCVEEEKR